MIDDPIVDEVRKHREARAAKFNFNIDAIFEDVRKREGTSGHKVVRRPKRKPDPGAGPSDKPTD